MSEALVDQALRDRRADLETLIRTSPLFVGLERTECATVAARCSFRTITGGALLCEQGSAGTEICIVMSGRLRAIRTAPDGTRQVLGEIARGELVGEMAWMTDSPRSADVVAIRDTVLAILSKAEFDQLVGEFPQLIKQVARLMVKRLSPGPGGGARSRAAETLCLIPAGAGSADIAAVGMMLEPALTSHGATFAVTSSTVPEPYRPGPGGDTRATATWLNSLETRHRFVIYVADHGDTAWTRLCLRQADLILLVGDATAAPAASPAEVLLESMSELHASRQLLLIHPATTALPRHTRQWLDPRPSVQCHFHLRANSQSDFERIARTLAGCPRGLVLGGGGARGFAHVGVYQALNELGFTIDMVAGTSMGASFGALIGMGLSPAEIVDACRIFETERVDYTLPMIALSGGFGLASASRKMFRDVQIEDLWLPYFCITTNLTRAEMAVHRSGPLAKWVRASCSLPGALPPVFDGVELHADGCLLNNLPVDVMRMDCGGPIVAVDVDQSVDMQTDLPYHEGISGWRLLLRHIFGVRARIPSLGRLFHRALMIANARTTSQARALADFQLMPPVQDCGVFEWKKGPRLLEHARVYTLERLRDWRSHGQQPE